MSLNTTAILNAIVSHAMSLGQFERFTRYEPKSPPGSNFASSEHGICEVSRWRKISKFTTLSSRICKFL